MTSEVVLLNKSGIVIAADSAVTVGKEPHPRYSKTANKIFDASPHGNLAVAIFGTGDIDQVPWELAVKEFRLKDSETPQRAKCSDYVDALFSFLQQNNLLFPVSHLDNLFELKASIAALKIIEDISRHVPSVRDITIPHEERQARWKTKFDEEKAFADKQALVPCLTQANYEKHVAKADGIKEEIVKAVVPNELVDIVDADALIALAIDYLFKLPWYVLSSTGIVFAGYGSEEIFPSFASKRVYGHIGDELCYRDHRGKAISHSDTAWIEPFAQSSMIERFTDGFDYNQIDRLESIVGDRLNQLIAELVAAGAQIDGNVASQKLINARGDIVSRWRQRNWEENFHPLRRVLAGLSTPEMAELAETLLVLESLRERVTSPSETVGGPVDVAVITKAEGLIWIKRKHFFAPELNKRYFKRAGI